MVTDFIGEAAILRFRKRAARVCERNRIALQGVEEVVVFRVAVFAVAQPFGAEWISLRAHFRWDFARQVTTIVNGRSRRCSGSEIQMSGEDIQMLLPSEARLNLKRESR